MIHVDENQARTIIALLEWRVAVINKQIEKLKEERDMLLKLKHQLVSQMKK